ncbi:hypothetical protein E2320_022834 [Naja naja]|nr:hypothetical protein E2320_022834 [Naja naja]
MTYVDLSLNLYGVGWMHLQSSDQVMTGGVSAMSWLPPHLGPHPRGTPGDGIQAPLGMGNNVYFQGLVEPFNQLELGLSSITGLISLAILVGEQDDRVILGIKAKNLFDQLNHVYLLVGGMKRMHHVQNDMGTRGAKLHAPSHFCSNILVWTTGRASVQALQPKGKRREKLVSSIRPP